MSISQKQFSYQRPQEPLSSDDIQDSKTWTREQKEKTFLPQTSKGSFTFVRVFWILTGLVA